MQDCTADASGIKKIQPGFKGAQHHILVRGAERAGKPEMPLRELDLVGIGKGFKFLPHGFRVAHL